MHLGIGKYTLVLFLIPLFAIGILENAFAETFGSELAPEVQKFL